MLDSCIRLTNRGYAQTQGFEMNDTLIKFAGGTAECGAVGGQNKAAALVAMMMMKDVMGMGHSAANEIGGPGNGYGDLAALGKNIGGLGS